MKFNSLAIVAAGLFAASSAFAGDQAGCATHAKNDAKKCAASFATLNLTTEQKGKMEKLAAECDKAGCTKESMATMTAGAKSILSAEQFTSWQACCAKMSEKKQS